MNRSSALALALLVTATPALRAQLGPNIVAGAVASGLVVDPPVNELTFSTRTSLAGGVAWGVALGNRIRLVPQVWYETKGVDAAVNIPGYSTKSSTKIGYVEMSAVAQFSVFHSRKMGAFLTVGPAISFKTSCTIAPGDPGNEACNRPDDGLSGYRATDMNLLVGGGLELQRFSLLLVYDGGLRNISNDRSQGANTIRSRAVFALFAVSLRGR